MSGEHYIIPTPSTTQAPFSELGPAQNLTRTTTVPVAREGLPVTGGDVVGLTVLGVIALIAGAVLTRRKRRSI